MIYIYMSGYQPTGVLNTAHLHPQKPSPVGGARMPPPHPPVAGTALIFQRGFVFKHRKNMAFTREKLDLRYCVSMINYGFH